MRVCKLKWGFSMQRALHLMWRCAWPCPSYRSVTVMSALPWSVSTTAAVQSGFCNRDEAESERAGT